MELDKKQSNWDSTGTPKQNAGIKSSDLMYCTKLPALQKVHLINFQQCETGNLLRRDGYTFKPRYTITYTLV